MKKISPDQICFGLNQDLDQSSFSCYLQLAGRPEVAETLASRMSSEEIDEFVTLFTGLLRKHFSGNEYHGLFLRQNSSEPTSKD
jgi:hypothetical protein